MIMARIRFTAGRREAEGFLALAKRTRVVSFDDDTYDVPKSALSVLDDLGIGYAILSEEGLDGVRLALRDTLTAQV